MTDHVKTLQKAREMMVEERHVVAEGLSKPYDPRKTPRLRSIFIEVQNTIDRIDKAIEDEQKLAPQRSVKGFSGDDRYTEDLGRRL